jgi:hypothetical protein
MDRLTGWDKDNAYIRECFERNEAEGGCDDMDTSKCTFCEHYLAIFKRLATYEDSGLSPEQVKELAKAKEEEWILPSIKRGDRIYNIREAWVEKERKYVKKIRCTHFESYLIYPETPIVVLYKCTGSQSWIEIGNLYLTREAAKTALEIGGDGA